MLNKFKTLITAHLDELGETYFEHMGHALHISLRLLLAATIQIIHAIFPFVCPAKLSSDVDSLRDFLDLKSLKNRQDEHSHL